MIGITGLRVSRHHRVIAFLLALKSTCTDRATTKEPGCVGRRCAASGDTGDPFDLACPRPFQGGCPPEYCAKPWPRLMVLLALTRLGGWRLDVCRADIAASPYCGSSCVRLAADSRRG